MFILFINELNSLIHSYPMTTLEDYADFAKVAQEAILSEDTVTMEWLGLEHTKQSIQREMVQLAYYTERSKTQQDCVPTREMYRLSILNSIHHMRRIIQGLQTRLKM